MGVKKKAAREIDAHVIAAVAAEAKVDPRTVRRALEGRTKTTVIREAIAAAFAARGMKAEARAVAGA